MNKIKRIIDIFMTLILIPLMAYQVTGEAAHEWLGVSMVLIVIIHQVLNRKWYASLFKENYNSYRILSIIIDALLIISFALTAISGVSMSNHAVPFLYNLINVNTARVMHLAFSYWSFILMGLHIGMHVNVMTAKIKPNIKNVLAIIFMLISGYGFYLFLKSGIINYITFRTHFAFLDYEKDALLVFLENVSMLIFFTFVGHNVSNVIREMSKKDSKILVPIVYILSSLIIGFILNMAFSQNDANNNSWQNNSFNNIEMTQTEEFVNNNMIEENNNLTTENDNNTKEENAGNTNNINTTNIIEVNDGFAKFDGGILLNNSVNNEKKNVYDMKLFIDDIEVNVIWEDNNSVNALKEISSNDGLIINMHQYGGFEQVGEIGQNIVSENAQMTTEAGDIVLYNNSNIVIFYGSNSWSYTKLGKIVGKTDEELKKILGKNNVELKIN